MVIDTQKLNDLLSPIWGKFCVYVIEKTDDGIYVGVTTNLFRRLCAHGMHRKVPYKQSFLREIKILEVYETRAAAQRREKVLMYELNRSQYTRIYKNATILPMKKG